MREGEERAATWWEGYDGKFMELQPNRIFVLKVSNYPCFQDDDDD